MSIVFPEITDPQFIEKIQKKKEIISANIVHKPNDEVDNYIKVNEILQWKEHQILEQRVMNPITNYKSMLIQLLTGGGKTLASLGIALAFNEIYKREWQTSFNKYESNDQNGNFIFIVGFTESIFKYELLNRPELGFISIQELKRKKELRDLAAYSEENKERYIEYIKLLKRRLSNKFFGGHFKFVGYRKMVNLLFKYPKNLSNMTMDEIRRNIGKDGLEIDTNFLKMFHNSHIG